MRDLRTLDEYRKTHPHYGHRGDHGNGFFVLPTPDDDATLNVIASNGGGWDHVSVSRGDRTPTWNEMSYVSGLFFKDNETCVQYHVPLADHVNCHEHCLHLWRPRRGKPLPRPPANFVGPPAKPAD